MKGAIVRIIGSLIVATVLLIYLFHGSAAMLQPQPYVMHSTLQSGQAK